ASGAAALLECQGEGEEGVEAADRVAEIDDQRQVLVAREPRETRGLLDVHRPPDAVSPRTVEPPARHPDEDESGVLAQEPLRREAEVVEDADREVLDDDVRSSDEPLEQLPSLPDVEAKRDAALSGIRTVEDRTAFVEVAPLERVDEAHAV